MGSRHWVGRGVTTLVNLQLEHWKVESRDFEPEER